MSLLFSSKITVIALIIFFLQPGAVVFASGAGDHHHFANKDMPMALHQHKSWQKVPVQYAGKRYKKWDNPKSIELGGKLYRENCLGCHGKDGKGTGEMAVGLAHPPADLTNHFHCRSGQGDDYLFWRISEGGDVEPFSAMDSAMPAFKYFVSSEERWAILSYVHSLFHSPGSEECQNQPKLNSKKRP